MCLLTFNFTVDGHINDTPLLLIYYSFFNMSMNSYSVFQLSYSSERLFCFLYFNITIRGEYRIRTDDPLLAKQVL